MHTYIGSQINPILTDDALRVEGRLDIVRVALERRRQRRHLAGEPVARIEGEVAL